MKVRRVISFKRVLALALVFLVLIGTAIPAQAAKKNKAARLSITFKSGADNDKTRKKNDYVLYYGAGAIKKRQIAKGLTASATIYIPRKMLSQEGSHLDISGFYDLHNKKYEYVGGVSWRYVPSVTVEGNKPVLYVWDTLKEKNVKASKYFSIKKGKGAYKDYYILDIKNVPAQTKIGETGKKLDSKTKYYIHPGISFGSISIDGTYKVYVDDITMKNESKTLITDNFSKATKASFLHQWGEKDITKKKMKLVEF
ncbi:MAG: hypothetical protein NC081_04750 [Roseburia sp.]|nr:hypothetical protein [Roseburia sp.]